MSFPNFPNPARRAKLLQAHQLRQQGLTLRQIAQAMGCAHSTVAAYLKDFELFRADLIHELAADQLVSHLLQLADLDDPHHDRRRADIRELRLLLTAVPKIRRDESERTQELVQGGVSVDRYGQRYPRPERFFPPTPEEIEQINQPHANPETELDPDQPLALAPEPSRTEPNASEHAERAQDTDAPARTEPNKPEHAIEQSPDDNGESEESGQNSPPQAPYPGYIDDPQDPLIQAVDGRDPRIREYLELSRRKRPFRFPQAPNPQDRWSWIDHPQDPIVAAARDSLSLQRILEQSRQYRQQLPA